MKRLPSSSRRGAILLQVVFMILVLMGLLALVIDMGIARVSQGYLQAGADAAAMEGLRLRDASSDLDRRLMASRVAGLVYDDDLDDGTLNATYRLGAGPQITTGVAGLDDPAGGLLIGDDPWIPTLATNDVDNATFGDLVAGDFEATDPGNPANANWHAEDATYVRADFAAVAAADSSTAPAFLARLRRTNDSLGLDNQPGVSSGGPTLPFLFGLGSGVLSSPDPVAYDPRRDGITLRATAIADARPAVAVGVLSNLVNGLATVGTDSADPTVPRVLGFLDGSWLTQLAVGSPFEIQVASDGSVVGIPGGLTPGVVGRALRAPSFLRLGDEVPFEATPAPVALPATAPGIEGTRYVALYDTVPAVSLNPVVVGFAAVFIDDAVPATNTAGDPVFAIRGQKLAGIVAPENASAVLALASDLAPAMIAAGLPNPDPARESLLAAVLVR